MSDRSELTAAEDMGVLGTNAASAKLNPPEPLYGMVASYLCASRNAAAMAAMDGDPARAPVMIWFPAIF